MVRTSGVILGWIGLLIGIGWGAAGAASAQPLSLDDLPATDGNTRFFEDRFAVRHPSLSLNGFSCVGLEPGGCAYGLGLAEILHAVYADTPNPAIKTIYETVLRLAEEDLVLDPTARRDIIENTRRIQARVFVALVSYLLERGGNDLGALNTRTEPDLPSHEAALRRFKEDLLQENAFAVNRSINDDAVKWPAVVTNVARAVDLYLALENAYRHYDDPDYDDENATRLLTCAEKGEWLYQTANSMRTLDRLANEEIIPGVSVDEVQPGNWPMKVHVAVGYAAMVQQQHDGRCFDNPEHDFEHWFNRALYSAGATTNQNRSKHWHYQTSSGKRFFAEGPYYFHLTLSEIVPFWHAVRLNDLLDGRAPVPCCAPRGSPSSRPGT